MPTTPRPARTLSSWKEIAAYLGKGVRTVQRWEQELGLPVRRPDSMNKGVVVATPQDLDLWLRQRWAKRGKTPANHDGAEDRLSAHVEAARNLRAANREIMNELIQNVQKLREECEALEKATTPPRAGKTRQT